MRFASVAEVKDGLSEYLAWAQKNKEPGPRAGRPRRSSGPASAQAFLRH